MQREFSIKINALKEFMTESCVVIAEDLPALTSGAKRTQHLGILFAILVLIEKKQEVTAPALSQLVGMPRPAINTLLKSLLSVGLVTRSSKVSEGRARYIYEPAWKRPKK